MLVTFKLDRELLLDGSGKTIWQHTRKMTRYHRGNPDGGGMMAKLADIDRDGRKEVIALAMRKWWEIRSATFCKTA